MSDPGSFADAEVTEHSIKDVFYVYCARNLSNGLCSVAQLLSGTYNISRGFDERQLQTLVRRDRQHTCVKEGLQEQDRIFEVGPVSSMRDKRVLSPRTIQ